MSYYIQIQKAIDYLEDHLTEDIPMADLSRVCGYSMSHLYRVFSGMTGYTIMEYVRKRRLSTAYYMLNVTKKTILDIALDLNYDSHEAFTRAFKAEYNELPSKVRFEKEFVLFDRINLLSSRKKDSEMKAEIVYKEKMTLLSCKQEVFGSVKRKFEIFKEVRERFYKQQAKVDQGMDDLYIAAYDFDFSNLSKSHDEMTYTYYYGLPVDEVIHVPKGLSIKHIEGGKYAVFCFDKRTRELNGVKIDRPVYDYINGVWLPESQYILSEKDDFEVSKKDSPFKYYYISVVAMSS